MPHFTLDFPHISLAFAEIGTGKNILLCAHGYKQTKEVFIELFDKVPSGWKILSFDQPMHGESIWENEEIGFDAAFFPLLWEKLIERYPAATWHLLGFSMGGKTAMMLQKTAPVPIPKMLFIAPAGVLTHPLTQFFSYHFWGSKIFTFFLKKPYLILPIFELLNKLKMMRPFSYRFAKSQFEPKENREYMLKFVPIYRRFHFSFEKYAQYLTTQPIELYVLWGMEDEVLPAKQANYLQKHLQTANIMLLPKQKHNIITTNKGIVAAWIKTILTQKNNFDL